LESELVVFISTGLTRSNGEGEKEQSESLARILANQMGRPGIIQDAGGSGVVERNPVENLKYVLYCTIGYESGAVISSYQDINLLFFASDFSLEVATSRIMASRPLTSLALPSRLLGKLTAAGYTTVSELRDLDADSLANGSWRVFPPFTRTSATRFSSLLWNTEFKLPIEACLEILNACNASSSIAIAGVLPSQPASTLLANRAAFGCGVPSLDSLINGGLKKGEVLEISGPPGSGKTSLALNFVKEAVSTGDEVLVMGASHICYVMLQKKVLELLYDRLSKFCATGTYSSSSWARRAERSSRFDT
jgi:hypothetical protein